MIIKDLNRLQSQTRDKAKCLQYICKKNGLLVSPFETLRNKERQIELYAIGRTTKKQSKPVTWTMDSRHLYGQAIDRVFEKTRWQGDRDAFRVIAKWCGFQKIPMETCHTEDNLDSIKETMSLNSARWGNSKQSYRKILQDINEYFRSIGHK